MTRSTRNITLGLVGSALMASCCITSGCLDTDQERAQREAELRNGTTTTHRSYHYWPRYYWWASPRYSYSPGIYTSSGGGASHSSSGGGTKSSSSTTTTRGGFGSSGHAVSGG